MASSVPTAAATSTPTSGSVDLLSSGNEGEEHAGYSDGHAASNAVGSAGAVAPIPEAVSMFDATRMKTTVEHANDMTLKYGVRILSINIISAKPTDVDLMNSLAKGAVAAAEAQQAETAAQGKAAAMQIEAQGFAQAQAQAEADQLRADGKKKAADTLEKSQLAVSLQKLEMTGSALSGNATFFFGKEPSADILGNMFANSSIISRQPCPQPTKRQ